MCRRRVCSAWLPAPGHTPPQPSCLHLCGQPQKRCGPATHTQRRFSLDGREQAASLSASCSYEPGPVDCQACSIMSGCSCHAERGFQQMLHLHGSMLELAWVYIIHERMEGESTFSRCTIASFWKVSSSKGKSWAMVGLNRSNSLARSLIPPRTAQAVVGCCFHCTSLPEVVAGEGGTKRLPTSGAVSTAPSAPPFFRRGSA